MRIVLDTNILTRAAASLEGPARELVNLILANPRHVLILSEPLITEVRSVLGRPYFRERRGITAEDTERFCSAIEHQAEMVAPEVEAPVIVEDPADDQVLYTAVAGRADVLCTLDRHFYGSAAQAFCDEKRIQVMDDVTLLKLLRGD